MCVVRFHSLSVGASWAQRCASGVSCHLVINASLAPGVKPTYLRDFGQSPTLPPAAASTTRAIPRHPTWLSVATSSFRARAPASTTCMHVVLAQDLGTGAWTGACQHSSRHATCFHS